MTDVDEDRSEESAPAPLFEPRRFRRGVTARSHAFAVLATAALVAPQAAGLRWSTWLGFDGGTAIVLAIACVAFAWPSPVGPGRARLSDAALGAVCAVGATAAFVALALATADGDGATAGQLAVAGPVLAAATILGRRGGAVFAAFALMVLVLVLALPRGLVVDAFAPGAEPAGARPGVESEVAVVELELDGPLTSAVVRADGRAPLFITAGLGAGERLTTTAWIAAPLDRDRFGAEFTVTAVEPPGEGEARVLAAFPGEGGAGWDSVAESLAARPRPALPRAERRAPPLESLFCAWAVLFVLTAVGGRLGTRRPALGIPLCLVIGVAGALACSRVAAALAPAGGDVVAGTTSGVRSLEGATGADGSTAWLQVDRARGALALDVASIDPSARVAVADGRPARTRLDTRGAGPVAVVEAGAGVAVDLVRPFDPGLRLLRPEVNTWSDLDVVWRRATDGTWSGHGAWPFGEGLPDPLQAAEPPGWCVLGLPAGVAAFAGRIEPGGFVGLGGAGPPAPFDRPDAPPGVGAPSAIWIRTIDP